jgi:hypothetical protein
LLILCSQVGRLVAAETHRALQLHGRDPAFARGDQEDRQKPFGEPGLGLLEDGPGKERMLLAAGRAFVDQALLERPRPAMAAGGAAKAFGPAGREQIGPALLVGPEALEKARQVPRQIRRQHHALQPVRHRRQITSTTHRGKPNLRLMDSQFLKKRRTIGKLVLDVGSLRQGRGGFKPHHKGNRST